MSEETFGQSVRRRREALGLLMKDLAEETSISRAVLYGIETGGYSVSDEIKKRLETALTKREKGSLAKERGDILEFFVTVHLGDRRVEVEIL